MNLGLSYVYMIDRSFKRMVSLEINRYCGAFMMSEQGILLPFHEWKDCEKLFLHLGAIVTYRYSRLRISMNGRIGIFHCPKIDEKIDSRSLDALKKFLEYAKAI